MYNKQLDTFLVVAECGSFTKAARKLYITASAVIQQITLLEEDLDVKLFLRTRQGVTLTPAGSVLLREAPAYIEKSKDLRYLVHEAEKKHAICVGTSSEEKIRLLFDLWMLYEEKRTAEEIHIVGINSARNDFKDSELIEAIKIDTRWQTSEWNFLKICDMPIGAAVDHLHPLYKKSFLSLEDMKAYTVLVQDYPDSPVMGTFYSSLEEMGLDIVRVPHISGHEVWDASVYHKIILLPLYLRDIAIDLDIKSCAIDFTVPYGIFSRKGMSNEAARFLKFIENVYSGQEAVDMIPIFS